MLSDNVQYEIIKPRTIVDSISSANENLILCKTYAGRELISVLGGMTAFIHFVDDDRVIKMNRLKGITGFLIWTNLIILITLKMGDLATSYLSCDC